MPHPYTPETLTPKPDALLPLKKTTRLLWPRGAGLITAEPKPQLSLSVGVCVCLGKFRQASSPTCQAASVHSRGWGTERGLVASTPRGNR
jgi:hypothetical protein